MRGRKGMIKMAKRSRNMKRGALLEWLVAHDANIHAPLPSETDRLWAFAQSEGIPTTWRSLYETLRRLRIQQHDGLAVKVVQSLEAAILQLQEAKALLLGPPIADC